MHAALMHIEKLPGGVSVYYVHEWFLNQALSPPGCRDDVLALEEELDGLLAWR